MTRFTPRLEILSESQRAIWPQLAFARERFVLYGGTALALRLGHRSSVDFDFFCFEPLDVPELARSLPRWQHLETLQWEANTLTVLAGGPTHTVKVSFFGGLSFGRVQAPDETADGVLRVASLADLFATKLNMIYQRAEPRDYLDIYALLSAGLELARGIEFARQVYGEHFNAMLPLQALCYFEEPPLRELPLAVREALIRAVQSVP